jgi:hypothetical protein
MEFLVLAFNSTHTAMHAQHILSAVDIAYAVMPAPAEITADCGIALKLEPKDGPKAHEALVQALGNTSAWHIHHAILKGTNLHITQPSWLSQPDSQTAAI